MCQIPRDYYPSACLLLSQQDHSQKYEHQIPSIDPAAISTLPDASITTGGLCCVQSATDCQQLIIDLAKGIKLANISIGEADLNTILYEHSVKQPIVPNTTVRSIVGMHKIIFCAGGRVSRSNGQRATTVVQCATICKWPGIMGTVEHQSVGHDERTSRRTARRQPVDGRAADVRCVLL